MSFDPDRASLIKARYALTILKNAKGSDRSTALRMVESLVIDSASLEESTLVAEAHHGALIKFRDLAEAFRSARDPGPLWYPAERAAQKWADLLER